MKNPFVMNSVENQFEPLWRRSKMGYEFDFHADVWQLDGSIRLNLGRMRELNSETRNGLRWALCYYAEEMAGASTQSQFTYFNNYCDFTGEREITVSGLTNWRASLTRDTEPFLGSLKAFIIAWYEWGFPGVSKDVVKYLDSLKLRGVIKGKPVKGGCPYSGPLTLLEQGSLIDWASGAFSHNILELDEYSLFLALSFTGRRLVQIRSLRAGDLIAKENDSEYRYVLNVPRVKQKGVGFREAFNSIPIVSDLYQVLRNQCLASLAFVEKHFNEELPDYIKTQLPIFLQLDRVLEKKSIEDLFEDLNKRQDYLHLNASRAGELLRQVAIKNVARSERTGEFIFFSSRRFRYTKGTNLSRRGIQGVALAEALDHSDTQNVHVYVENTMETAAQIDAIMAPILAPLAQAFAGKLVASERDAIRGNDPHSRVKNGEANNIGSCGTYNFCASGYRACYTCFNFQPWIDAPHEEVRDEILAERAEQKEAGVSPFVIQSTDRLLLAIEQVIILCGQAKVASGSVINE